MGVYIKGMEMPKPGHYEAVIFVSDKSTAEIGILPAENEIDYWKKYPLIPVPEHGDLIERQAVLETFSIHMNRGLHFVTIRDTIPTIIPAEPPKEETV